MKKTLTMSCLSFAMAAGAITFAPSSSAAVIGDCNTWQSNTAPYAGSAYCSKVAWGDKFRVKVTCVDPRGSKWTAYGPWKRNTQTSTAKCSDSRNVGVAKVGIAFSW